jgi:hypothetical protein
VTYGWIVGVMALAFGGFLAVHCPRSAIAEFRSGVAKGRHNNFSRDHRPVAFWLTILATALAGVMGFCFAVFGLVVLGTAVGLIR